MKRTLISFMGLFCSLALLFSQSTVKVNQLGYLTGYSKYAWVNDLRGNEIRWTVKRASDNQIVHAAIIKPSEKPDPATGEMVTRLDFSSINEPGYYYVEVENTGVSFDKTHRIKESASGQMLFGQSCVVCQQ